VKKKRKCESCTENTSSNSSTNAPAATLGDNDVLAALKAKMEKTEK
jgi:small subunit ribosomal protein S1